VAKHSLGTEIFQCAVGLSASTLLIAVLNRRWARERVAFTQALEKLDNRGAVNHAPSGKLRAGQPHSLAIHIEQAN
jgi:hypothetical protein